MFTYNISKIADNKAFKDACTKIEDSKLELVKDTPLVDVDGTVIQIYKSDGKKIKVYNDYEVDAVYIDSDIDLDMLFKAS